MIYKDRMETRAVLDEMDRREQLRIAFVKTDDEYTTIGFRLRNSDKFKCVDCYVDGCHRVRRMSDKAGTFRLKLRPGTRCITLEAHRHEWSVPVEVIREITVPERADPQTELIRRIVREELAAAKAEETDRRQQMLADIRARRPVDAFVKYEDDPDHQGNEPDEEPYAWELTAENGYEFLQKNHCDGWFPEGYKSVIPLYRRGSERT